MTVFVNVESGGEELQHPKKVPNSRFSESGLDGLKVGIHKIGLSA